MYGDNVDFDISLSNRNISRGNPTNDQDDIGPKPRKKRLQRLTFRQNQILQGHFSFCAHPDEYRRRELSEITGLTEQQVKFWFQNKITQVKNLNEKEENYRLKVENVRLSEENKKLKEAQRTMFCPTCDPLPHNQLSPDMQRLKDQNNWLELEISQLQSQLQAETLQNSRQPFQHDSSAENVVTRQNDIQIIAELTNNAMDEFTILSNSHGPLWLPVTGGSFEILNKVAYATQFGGKNSADKIGLKTEATRANVVVMMGTKNIMDYLMDSECYASLCPGILSSAKTIKAYKWPTNVGYDGAMHLMTIETVFPSPLVPSRKYTFVRSCRELQNGTTLIVDVSLDSSDGTFFQCRKMPSGVLIQPLEHNSCKIIVIEHVLVDDTGVQGLYQPCLSGLMFGARRWATSIARQCLRLRDTFHVITRNALRANSKGRKSLMKLADGMLVSYSNSIAAIPEDAWTIVCGAGTEQDIKIAHRRNHDRPNTAVVSWDVLVKGGVVREEVCVSGSIEADDTVSTLHVKNAAEKKENIMILQNSCYDVSGSFIVYAPIDTQLMNKILSPGDMGESNVSIYPTGFSLLPVSESAQGGIALGEDGETLVTVGFQILLKLGRGNGLCPKSVAATIDLMSENIATIKTSLINSQSHVQRTRGKGRHNDSGRT
ncbi:hypothetical protein QYE76_051586 [Lolium multiflorum]|uniref:Uncharacterized protein n=1 Tax=Lolium multiflorum TaxID=4521 RepID=A0AAD8WI16_LOLMU|nr:hypothetical protein QYE76_051586 [Lolium multiflorum]